MKQCIKCKESKELSSYQKDKSRIDGLYPVCSECRKAYTKQYYSKNKQEVKTRRLNYYYNNKDLIRSRQPAYQRKYMQDPFYKVKRRLRNRLYYAKTTEELYKLCYYTNLTPMWASDNIKKGAKV